MVRWQRLPTKYGNKKIQYDGKTFDSKKEAERYWVLKMLEDAGDISDLRTQVPFELIPSQRGEDGKVIERAITYIADFTYWQDGRFVVEDAKGFRTEVYKIKKKLMLHTHGIRIKEV